ncbi:50S ribosomal protein L3 [Rhodohalobacter mucosus]|uniref:Large ribosomal subunit protein uL3 n=1 Tax=Rhodohalobacter mucosus TaxID=2079485 RepID=A0A316TKZ5_9BACT|nr:50S ribosomal protein L3 [Rhodohalobacter mucosus]PWN05040.1 50S ribosomal protein L3 [Rhodohalobacter mucosus]
MSGLIGKKVGMTSIFDDLGRSIAVTVVEVEPCTITQIKTEETDGYNAVQVAAFSKKAKNVSNALLGHFDKAGSEPKRVVTEFRDYIPEGFELGDELNIEDVFSVGDRVDIVGISKGTGFTGVVKRHNFSGVGDRTHGQHNRERAPGSIGQASDPSRVFKGMKMAGRSGNRRTKIQNLSVAQILPESNLVLITGSIPGAKGGYLEIHNKSQQLA